MKKPKIRHLSDRKMIFVLIIVIACVVGVLALVADRLSVMTDRQNVLWSQVNGTGPNPTSAAVGSLPVKVYIQDAAKLLYPNSGVVNTQDNRVYFPELKISVPMSQLSRDLRYGYTAADKANNTAEQASFQSQLALNMLIQSFNDVPCQQRLAGVVVDQKDGYQNGGKYAGSVSLDDGRTLYIYTNETNQTKGCGSFWSSENPSSVVALLKQAPVLLKLI